MKTDLLVYLAGPMTGQTFEEATAWREWATEALWDEGFTVLDPSRGLMFLKPESVVKDAYADTTTENKHVVFVRDRFDSTRADILLMNLIGADRVSIGSMMELAWSHLSGKFPVVVMEKEGNPHQHAFVREATGIVLHDLGDAVDYVVRTFGGK